MAAERRPGDDLEQLLLHPRDREVALDPTPAIEHLRVGDRPHLPGDVVVAQSLEQLGGAGPGNLELGERGLVEQPRSLARGQRLGADRRRPVPAGPPPGPQVLGPRRGIALIPVHPLPAGLLPENRAVLAVPGVHAGGPQRTAGLALMARVADVVVGLVDLLGPGERVAGRAVMRPPLPEAADVHLPHVERRLAGDDPLGHQLADPARAGQPVRAEAGGDEQPMHLGLTEAELVVGRERLRPVDQPRDLDLLHRRDAARGIGGDLLKARPVLLQQAPVEVRRDPVQEVLVERPWRAVALVAAHHQPGALFAEVDQQVGIAQRRQMDDLPFRPALAERLGDEILVRERDHRYPHARHPAELGGKHPARVHHDLGLDLAPLRAHAADASLLHSDLVHARVGEHLMAALAGPFDQRVGQLRGVQVAVGRKDRRRSGLRR